MKKNAPLCVLCLLLGCLAGLALNFSLWDGGGLFSAYIPSGAAVPGAEAPSPENSVTRRLPIRSNCRKSCSTLPTAPVFHRRSGSASPTALRFPAWSFTPSGNNPEASCST